MPRHEIVERLFDARYEYETTVFLTKAQAEARYRAVELEATEIFGCTKDQLLKTVGPLFIPANVARSTRAPHYSAVNVAASAPG